MPPQKKFMDLTQALDDAFRAPSPEESILPLVEEVIEELRTISAESESLQRYRETRKRLGDKRRFVLTPPNYPYTIHSV